MKAQITPPQAPDTANFIDIGNHHTLLRYFQNIEQKFRYANNIGVAIDDDDKSASGDKAVYLRELFVVPKMSTHYRLPEQVIQTENDPKQDLSRDLVEAIKPNPRLCILGDPGTGKSTLSQWLTLALSYSGENLTKLALGDLVPFVLVLRDLPLGGVKNWQDLWWVFLEHNKQSLTQCVIDDQTGAVERLFASGQALILLDGLDEITHSGQRQQLADAVWQAMSEYPRCRFIITSRVVGFNQREWLGLPKSDESLSKSSIRVEIVEAPTEDSIKPSSSIGTKRGLRVRISHPDDQKSQHLLEQTESVHSQSALPFTEHYLSPFNYGQLQRFVHNWYQQYIPNAQDHSQRISDLLQRLKLNDGLGRLARIPVLLNMICFIHARRGRLPDGRAELYQRIAETYLVSLDKARGLKFKGQTLNLDYHDLSQWLGKIAWELQQRRTERDSGLLMAETEVKKVLLDCLDGHGFADLQSREQHCDFILGYLTHRSGLFIPRGPIDGEEHYAFAHLSFLEYFAACYLEQEAPFFKNKDWKMLNKKVQQAWWHETLALFFECQTNARLAEKYLKALFPKPPKGQIIQQYTLLADIVLDTSVRLPQALRESYITALWYLLADKQNNQADDLPQLATALWQNRFVSLPVDVEFLCLNGAAITDLRALSSLANLKELYLNNTQVSDLQALASLTRLQRLELDNTQVSDLQALAGLTSLRVLFLDNPKVSDLQVLAGLTNLQTLTLNDTQVRGLQALAGLTNLQELFLHNAHVNDLQGLADLKRLKRLDLDNTQISDLKALAALTNLQELYLSDTQVSDLQALAGLTSLQVLNIKNTHVSDLQALASLTNLQYLELNNTQVSDLQALAGLTNLQILSLNDTHVNDLQALAGLINLQELWLSNTQVSDLQALAGLTNLHLLDLDHTQVNKQQITRLKEHLPNLFISFDDE